MKQYLKLGISKDALRELFDATATPLPTGNDTVIDEDYIPIDEDYDLDLCAIIHEQYDEVFEFLGYQQDFIFELQDMLEECLSRCEYLTKLFCLELSSCEDECAVCLIVSGSSHIHLSGLGMPTTTLQQELAILADFLHRCINKGLCVLSPTYLNTFMSHKIVDEVVAHIGEMRIGESNAKIQGGSIRCTECEFCKDRRNFGNTRGAFVCKHPDSLYIEDYFREHKLQKMEGFIGFGERFKDKPAIKTSPAWCPKKRDGGR